MIICRPEEMLEKIYPILHHGNLCRAQGRETRQMHGFEDIELKIDICKWNWTWYIEYRLSCLEILN